MSGTEATPIFDALLDEFWPVVTVVSNPDGTVRLDDIWHTILRWSW
ncbi:MAG TPA: hypothetical protein VLS51_00185 [Propionibacteriaceae bacterium]|nr:hypothetical protein [Propionibacteriaceae bacterium]